MCLILLGWRAHPDFPLVVAANRDEFHKRPTAPAGFWTDHPQVLAGRDLLGGGTWMGVTRNGRFAALTNYRNPQHMRPDAPSRGPLVSRFLTGSDSPMDYLAQVERRGGDFNGFNLLVGNGRSLAWYSNVSGEMRTLEPGVYGLSNELLDTPWPKVERAKSDLSRSLGSLPDDTDLLHLLRDDRIYPDEALPRTGVSIELERMLSAAFIRADDQRYGTRSSTVLLQDRDGMICFDEQQWKPDASTGERRRFRFKLA